jgi:hypothetical protein
MTSNSDDAPGAPKSPANYANYLQVGYNAVEFVLVFGEYRRAESVPRFHAEIVTSPIYAKAFLQLLEASVRKYEAEYGPLPEE